jgi:phenylalanyl-tRNA synthetase beta chain
MPVINVPLRMLHEFGLTWEDAVEGITRIGGEVSRDDENCVFEVSANRWDLFTPEGIIHAIQLLMGRRVPEKYVCPQSGIVMDVDKSVRNVRPFVVGAVVENVRIDSMYIAILMQIQEKMHDTIGRKRKKLAIGIHDLDKVTPPFTYMAVQPEKIAFEPLGFSETMHLAEILAHHPKGREYGWILEGAERFPVIIDANGEVLSFPPIINGTLTEVTEHTKNLFIDMTGTDLKTLKYALNVLTHALSMHGGTVKSVKINAEQEYVTPDFTWKTRVLEEREISALLGFHVSADKSAELLSTMGYICKSKGNAIEVEIPPYRCDVMHNVDVIEDIAIAYGYDNIKPVQPERTTHGVLSKMTGVENLVRKYFVGMGAQEICSFVLSSERVQFEMMDIPKRDCVRTKNPSSLDFSILRTSLLPNVLSTISRNQQYPMPLKFFEIGLVVEREERHNLCYASVHARAGFSEIKSVAESFLKEFEIAYEIEPVSLRYYIDGRCARITVKNKPVGTFGEIHPKVLENFKIGIPVIALEFDLSSLFL